MSEFVPFMFGLSWGILNNSEGLCWINLIGFLIIHANLIPYLLICFTVTLEVFLKMIFSGALDNFGVLVAC